MVAVKCIDKRSVADKVAKRIENEVRIMRYLMDYPHPNIVHCYDVVETESFAFLILEYCESGDLMNVMKSPVKEKYVQFYICQLVQGIRFLNDHNIYHHDIKPKNVLLTMNRKVVKVADFGFAEIIDKAKDIPIVMCGSPLYMAPEIMNRKEGDRADLKTDLWSIGMLMYEMLFGIHPFRSSTTLSHLIERVNREPIEIPPKHTTNRKISDDCLDVLERLLEKDTDKRMSWTTLFSHTWIGKYWVERDDTDAYSVKYHRREDDSVPFSFSSLPGIEEDQHARWLDSGESTSSSFEEFNPEDEEQYPISRTVSKPIPIPKR